MATIEVNYFNTYMLNKLNSANTNAPVFPKWLGGLPETAAGTSKDKNWYVEESRITGGFNNTQTDLGVRAYIVEDNQPSQVLISNIIYSGIFNSRTGFNETNVFSVGEDITKAVDPANGSIQKLYAEDTNLIIFQENKVSRALIDKDAIYSAEGAGAVTSTNLVIGQIVPYAGNFGISTNPESFAVYGYRKYFTDTRRNAVLRLSQDGLTEIQNYGMLDYFRDKFEQYSSSASKVLGGFDIHNKTYVTSIQNTPSYTNGTTATDTYETLYYDEAVRGWVSKLSFKPTLMGSLRNKFFSFYDGKIYQHYSNSAQRGNFYDQATPTAAYIEFIFNPQVSMPKVFKTINYEGDNGWEVANIKSDPARFIERDNVYMTFNDTAKNIYSYDEGLYTQGGVQYRAGFNKKENKYFANVINDSAIQPEEIIYGKSISGVKGMFLTVTIQTDSSTDLGGAKELFAVSSEYVESSY